MNTTDFETDHPTQPFRGVNAVAEWRSPLTIVTNALLLFAALTGLSVYLLPFSLFNQFSLLLHTLAGILMLVPVVWFALVRGHDTGWLRFERELVALLILLSVLVPGPATQMGVSLSFAASGLVALILYRRLRVELASA